MAAPTNEGAAPPSPPACTVIAAVLQNRAREVGVALFDKRGGPSLDLEQHVEVGESHATTLCELQRARPGVILTLAGDRGGALGDALARFARAHDCALVELPRKQFGARPPRGRPAARTAVRTVAPVASKRARRPTRPLAAHHPAPRPQQTTSWARTSSRGARAAAPGWRPTPRTPISPSPPPPRCCSSSNTEASSARRPTRETRRNPRGVAATAGNPSRCTKPRARPREPSW
mmetsp:Transcript_4083/g.16707  ORF Transcript_4083/g.16707 Transcript_4083/m.16707 type:complete len:233 (+) Transcript_4083:231-929(+)